MTQDNTGRLVDFFDTDALLSEICELLEDRAARQRLGGAARDLVRTGYDLRTICLPRQIDWVSNVMLQSASD